MPRVAHLAVLAALFEEGVSMQHVDYNRASMQQHHNSEKRGSETPLGVSLSKGDVATDGELRTQLAMQDEYHEEADGGAAQMLARRREQAEFRARVKGHAADPKMEACRGVDECKLPLCRWLELTRNDEAGRCPIFEKELMACAHWKPVEARKDNKPAKVDCAVDILRRTDVVAKRVQSNVDELEVCMNSLEGIFPDTRCDVAFGLIYDAIADYKFRASLQANMTDVRAELRDEIPIVRAALSVQGQNEEEVAEALHRIVERAELMPGAVMVEEIDEANKLLDQLVPIPAAREQLQVGMNMSEAAFNHGDLHSVEESIAWMELAVANGERFNVGDPVAESQQTVEKLRTLRTAVKDLDDADFSANVSLVARSNVDASIEKLEQSIAQTQAAGLQSPGLQPARTLLKNLTDIRDTLKDVKEANRMAEAALADDGNKGVKNIHTVFKALNTSINRAFELGLAANSSVTDAVGKLDSIRWVWNARQALHHANHLGQKILSQDNRNVSDDKEEEVMSYITPALEWAKELHIRNGMGEAKRVYDLLSKEESAKEEMSGALAQANASLGAVSNIEYAIKTLEDATTGEVKVQQAGKAHGKEASLVAGQSLAKDMLKKLYKMRNARDKLYEAQVNLNESLKSGDRLYHAGNRLNQSIMQARANGLDKEAAVAAEKLDYYKLFLAAKRALFEALKKEPAARPVVVAEVKDTKKTMMLVREGLEPKDLGPVDGAADDYDADFDEHIEALQKALEAGRQQGYVDSKQQALLAKALAMRDAHDAILTAMEAGEDAFATKSRVQDAIVAITGALVDVSNFGIKDDVADADVVLGKLKPIEPARTQLERAMLQATIAFKTESDLGDSWRRLTDAITLNRELNITDKLGQADALLQIVMVKKEAAVNLKAAMIHGDIAMKTKAEEELAMQELEASLAQARRANLTRKLPEAENLLEELLHLHLEEETLEETMNPHGDDLDNP